MHEEMTTEQLFYAAVGEAQDRLKTGIATDIDDAIDQLLEESIFLPHQEKDARRMLEQLPGG